MLQGGRKIFPEFYIRKVFLTQCVVAYINEGTRIRGENSYLSRSEYLSTMLPRTTPSPYKKMLTVRTNDKSKISVLANDHILRRRS